MTDALQTLLLVALVAAAVATDVASRRIPNALTLTGLVAGLALRVPEGVDAFAVGVLGAGVALALALPLVLAGGLGGGDAKLLAAVGAFVGIDGLPVVLLVTAVAGGAMAITLAARHGAIGETLAHCRALVRRVLPGRGAVPVRTLATPGALAVPYGVAIALGALVGWWA
ncbi:MAG: prepilin peptidase [Gemmatimonadetes bacterium]|nr:prepilin peptidase [Gemmatimonadota bacterium]